jgi:hypothetical protein
VKKLKIVNVLFAHKMFFNCLRSDNIVEAMLVAAVLVVAVVAAVVQVRMA